MDKIKSFLRISHNIRRKRANLIAECLHEGHSVSDTADFFDVSEALVRHYRDNRIEEKANANLSLTKVAVFTAIVVIIILLIV
jgi:transposase-like protein